MICSALVCTEGSKEEATKENRGERVGSFEGGATIEEDAVAAVRPFDLPPSALPSALPSAQGRQHQEVDAQEEEEEEAETQTEAQEEEERKEKEKGVVGAVGTVGKEKESSKEKGPPHKEKAKEKGPARKETKEEPPRREKDKEKESSRKKK